MASLGPMSDHRLPWGSREDPVSVGWAIERLRKDRLSQLAAHAGVSNAVFLEAVIDHLEEELNDRGLPFWWPAQEPKDGELPIGDVA
ncbi:hypothetical protein HMPREF1529_03086 [Microbacterium sp. oral taxon 186 str. F0373]|nr:hypothetical protein HMPREF1529_03086 [Microbacterium sp. oral taxon 186 str. F0373]